VIAERYAKGETMAALTSEFGVELPYADSHAERAWTIRTFGFGWRHTGELSSAPPTAPSTVTPAKSPG
jgi:hypothetical protein